MPPKIFLTGATGYIGGQALYSLYQAHPEYEYTLLVRNEERGRPVADQYPNVRLVYGDLKDADVFEKEAAAADVVVHTADSADSLPSALAIAKGIEAGHSAERPGYWIHVSGTGILQWYDQTHKRYGQEPIPDQKYHDIDDIARLLDLPPQAAHRNVDVVVQGANKSDSIRTLIVCPPTIYASGQGPVNQRSMQVNGMSRQTFERDYAPIVAPGKAEWDHVHIHDLGNFFVLAVEAALDNELNKNPEIFGPHGYFFLENGVHVWSEVAQWVGEESLKRRYIKPRADGEPVTKMFTAEELKYSTLGFNSKGVAARARKYLGWEPKGESLKDAIPEIVRIEAEIAKVAQK